MPLSYIPITSYAYLLCISIIDIPCISLIIIPIDISRILLSLFFFLSDLKCILFLFSFLLYSRKREF